MSLKGTYTGVGPSKMESRLDAFSKASLPPGWGFQVKPHFLRPGLPAVFSLPLVRRGGLFGREGLIGGDHLPQRILGVLRPPAG